MNVLNFRNYQDYILLEVDVQSIERRGNKRCAREDKGLGNRKASMYGNVINP